MTTVFRKGDVDAGDRAGMKVKKFAVEGHVIVGIAERRGSALEITIAPGPHGGDILAIPNFEVTMPLPEHWREGMDAGYVADKLSKGRKYPFSAPDADTVVMFLRYAVRYERGACVCCDQPKHPGPCKKE